MAPETERAGKSAPCVHSRARRNAFQVIDGVRVPAALNNMAAVNYVLMQVMYWGWVMVVNCSGIELVRH